MPRAEKVRGSAGKHHATDSRTVAWCFLRRNGLIRTFWEFAFL